MCGSPPERDCGLTATGGRTVGQRLTAHVCSEAGVRGAQLARAPRAADAGPAQRRPRGHPCARDVLPGAVNPTRGSECLRRGALAELAGAVGTAWRLQGFRPHRSPNLGLWHVSLHQGAALRQQPTGDGHAATLSLASALPGGPGPLHLHGAVTGAACALGRHSPAGWLTCA